jgi:hypothetical protein
MLTSMFVSARQDRWWNVVFRPPAVVTFGRLDIIDGMARDTYGSRVHGCCLHVRALATLLRTGFTGEVAGCSSKGTGGNRRPLAAGGE